MATVYENSRGQWIVQFSRPGRGKHRPTLHLGKVDKSFAHEVCLRVERMLEAEASNRPPDIVTLQWLTQIPAKLQKKLADHGFVDGPKAATLSDLCNYCIAQADVEPSTMQKYRDAKANLIAFFGERVEIHRVSSGDAHEFKRWLKTSGRRPKPGPLAESTVAKRLEQSKLFFAVAIRKRWILTNPFDGMSFGAAENPDRQAFVPAEIIERILEHAPPEMALLIRLARWGGLRIPSEITPLQWGQIDWEAGTITFLSRKTRRYPHKRYRTMPLFPEIRDALWDAHEAAPDGATLIFPGLQDITATAIRNRLERLCRKAAVVQWEKIWQNLRSTRETELLENYPIHVVCAWLGNSVRVAIRNYGQVTKDHIRRACGETCSASQRGVSEAENALQNSKCAGARRRTQPGGNASSC